MQEAQAKFRELVRGLTLKATFDQAKIVELFHKVQVIAAKIKAMGSISLMECKEYVVGHFRQLLVTQCWRRKGLKIYSRKI